MSRRAPIYLSDSDSEEEPMEESFVPESPLVHDRVTSDDTYVPPPTQHVTTPVTTPHATRSQFHIGEPSRRPGLVRAPRKRVGALPIGSLAPRDKTPMTEPEEPSQRRFPHLDYMPYILGRWRALEGIPSALETGESSRPLSVTGEPVELTVITLVAAVRVLYGLHYGTRGLIRELRSDTSRLDGDVMSIYGRLSTVETHVDEDRESADTTRLRVAILERCARLVGVILGVCLVLAVVVTAMWIYLSYLY